MPNEPTLPRGQYRGLPFSQAPTIYLQDLRDRLRSDGTDEALEAALDTFLGDAGDKVYVTMHAVDRWSARVLGIGRVSELLAEQARRAWDDGAVLPARDGAERRRWRGLVWVFARRRRILSLLTVFPIGEKEVEAAQTKTQRLDLEE